MIRAKKKKLLFICSTFSSTVFAEQVKKLNNKEFVIRKQRNDTFKKIQKPKYVATDLLKNEELKEQISIQDVDLDIQPMPVNLDLHGDKKNLKKKFNNLIRFGAGAGFNSDSTYFVQTGDILLKKKIKDFSTHLIFKSRNPYYAGWNEKLQLFADYWVTNFCIPFVSFDQSWRRFKSENFENKKNVNKKINSNLNFGFKIGCPLVFEKSEFNPSVSFRISNFGSAEEEKEELKAKEHEVDLNFDMSMQIMENQEFIVDASLKNLNYDKKMSIVDREEKILKPLEDNSNVTFFHIQPKYLFSIAQVSLAPKFSLDYCSNKKFIQDDRFSWLIGFEGGYKINDIADVYLDFNNGMKVNTLKKFFKKNPWLEHQAIISSVDKLGLSLGGHVNLSNIKFNADITINNFNIYPQFVSTKQDEEKHPKYSLEYADMLRFKETLGCNVEINDLTFLFSGTLYQYKSDEKKKFLYCPSFKIKSDIFFKIIDKILLHLNMRCLSGIKSEKKDSDDDNEIFPLSFNIGLGGDYVFSELFTFFLDIENLLMNTLTRYDNCPVGRLKIILGASITPDRWIDKE